MQKNFPWYLFKIQKGSFDTSTDLGSSGGTSSEHFTACTSSNYREGDR